MEEQCADDEHHKPLIGTKLLEDGSHAKNQSQILSPERDCLEGPSTTKRWEIGPILQTFKSKMASFTDIVMSPVRLFKINDPMSSITLPDQHNSEMVEAKGENATQTEEGETDADPFRRRLFPKRPSSETVQCTIALKRCSVAQLLDFSSASTNDNHKLVLDVMNNEVAPNEAKQIDHPSDQPQAVLQERQCFSSPGETETSLHSLSTNKPLHFESIACLSCESTLQKDSAAVLNHLPGGETEHASKSDTGHEHSFESSEQSTIVSTETNSSTNITYFSVPCSTIGSSTSSDLDLTDKVICTNYSQMPIRKSPRKKIQPGMMVSVSNKPDSLMMMSKFVCVRRKKLQPKRHLEGGDIITDAFESLEGISVLDSRSKRCRGPCSVKNNMETGRNCGMLERNEERNDGVNPEINQESETHVQEKERSISATQTLQNANLQEMELDRKTRWCLRKLLKSSQLKTSSSETSVENCTENESNRTNGSSETMQQQELGKITGTQKRRRHLRGSSDSFDKGNVQGLKQTVTDGSLTSEIDSAGTCRASKEKSSVRETEEQTKACVSLKQRQNRRSMKVKCPSRKYRKGAMRVDDEAENQANRTQVVPQGSSSNRLLRSYSCPEIPSLVCSDYHLPRSHTHTSSTTSLSRQSLPTPLPVYHHSPSKRTRRHTVCSVEMEREIAPLCLRKEVYPASRGSPMCPSSPHSPFTSITALASCFLSSPLAFLSRKQSTGHAHSNDASSGRISGASGFIRTPSPSFSCPSASTFTSCHALSTPSTLVTPSPETPSTSVSSLCSTSSQSAMEGDKVLQMECEEALAEEHSSSFDFKLSATFSEEKAFSDSKIKTDSKDGQRGKVSSIRICKKIPKAQNNLTPMGLPKIIRAKKKDFSLEEIYTNKNFSKPPDGRLETIFEVPFKRRNGSQAVVGPKKLKRFVEFPELGVARKPKKPLVGLVAGGGTQRKPAGNSRPRRGLGVSSKVEEEFTLQELESLLFSKLEELDSWMALQQVAS